MLSRMIPVALVASLTFMVPAFAWAHVSEQGLILLLPTKVYITAGVLAVLLTVLLLAALPISTSHRLMEPASFKKRLSWPTGQTICSLVSLACLLLLIVFGFLGSRDPLKNPLPLYIWTFWWIGLVGIQGFLGNLWHWINPWSGICKLLRVKDETPLGRRLKNAGVWPAIGIFLLFIVFALAYPGPDDPDLLASVVLAYWLLTLIAMMVFGQKSWRGSAEFIGIVMKFYARMSPFRLGDDKWQFGIPGHRGYMDSRNVMDVSMAVFVLVLLGCGSFDGINETFWWLSSIGINPLEFPGRSAIVTETIVGILLANVLLVAMFLFCVWLGLRLLGAESSLSIDSTSDKVTTARAFVELSISMLPIAFAYHLAHFLVTFLVNMQYLLATSSDPLATGSDLLGLGTFYVTTGFLNTHHSVEFLWLLQAGIVVLGHILSVIMAHGIAVRLFGTARRAVLSQIPLAVFMIFYTFLGLWLLASPKGG